ncbi:hypothetical protein GEMRC1_004404 [Eukaryota sp. GEM-RC1]
MNNTTPFNYSNAQILAPMVRVTNLPFRLLAYEYGADFCYCEELIDYGLLKCSRIDIGDLVQLAEPSGKVIFSTRPSVEKDRMIFQVGSNDGSRAAKALLPIADVLSEVGLNLGCPAPPNIKGNMGAALGEKPEQAADVIRTLNRGLNLPVSAKIRIQPTRQQTQVLVDNLIKAGICALSVHGRTRDMKGSQPALWDEIQFALDIAKRAGIPAIANGSVTSQDDVTRIKEATDCDGVMIGRAAQLNPSIFRRSGVIDDQLEVTKKYLQYVKESRMGSKPQYMKYCVQHFLGQDRQIMEKINPLKTLSEVCAIVGVSYDLIDCQNPRRKNEVGVVDCKRDRND